MSTKEQTAFVQEESEKMIAIKGMDMPKSCAECRFKETGGYDEWIYWCKFTGSRLGNFANTKTKWHTVRRKNCPMVDIVECKDCKHYHKAEPTMGDISNVSYCTIEDDYLIGFPNEDDYCSYGERKDKVEK